MTDISPQKEKFKQGVPKGYYGVKDLCELFGRSHTTIYQMIAEGKLPKPWKHGRQNIWDKKKIDHNLKYGNFLD